jgi:hypothetical protein
VGRLRGNAQGFPDRDDFSPERPRAETLRVAVFGDSFTSGQFLEKNWPDTAEDLANENHGPGRVELLNFSIDGGGLANWWSILKHILEKEDYHVDALLFPVFHGDLYRGFSIAEHRGYSRHMFNRLESWNVDDWPKTDVEARQYLEPLDGYIVTKDEFDKALDGEWLPSLSRPWRPYFAISAVNLLARLAGDNESSADKHSNTERLSADELFSSGQEALIKDIADFAKRKAIPIIVVRVPSQDDLIEKIGPRMDTYHFSRLLDARFVDGRFAYKGWTDEQISSGFFPFDHHWNQIGSNAFARYMVYVLEEEFAADLVDNRKVSALAP